MIKAFTYRAQAIFSLLEKSPPPPPHRLQNFIILHYKYPKN
jgi:hypothetical protein